MTHHQTTVKIQTADGLEDFPGLPWDDPPPPIPPLDPRVVLGPPPPTVYVPPPIEIGSQAPVTSDNASSVDPAYIQSHIWLFDSGGSNPMWDSAFTMPSHFSGLPAQSICLGNRRSGGRGDELDWTVVLASIQYQHHLT